MHQPRSTAALVLAVSTRPAGRPRVMASGPAPARPAESFDLDHVFQVVAALSRQDGTGDDRSSRVHSITLDRSHLEVLISVPASGGGFARSGEGGADGEATPARPGRTPPLDPGGRPANDRRAGAP